MKKKVVLVGGKKRHGKDYLSELLVSEGSFKRFAFADNIKTITREIFEVTDKFLDEAKNNPSEYGIEIKAYPDNQPSVTVEYTNFRSVLQRLGTEAMKPIFGEDVWVRLVEKQILESPEECFVISDFRFIEEFLVLNKNPNFELYTVLIEDKSIENDEDLHPSETSLDNFCFDLYIDNTDHKDITEDVDKIKKIVKD